MKRKQQKTIREWFQELPADIRDKALAAPPLMDHNMNVSSMYNALTGGIDWELSEEGFDYWSKLSDKYYGQR